jgi:hypothetical protein
VALLSLTVLATAWSGYQASLWSGERSQRYAQASATRIKSQQASTHAGQSRIDDLLYFNGWLDGHQAGNEGLANISRRRFRRSPSPTRRANHRPLGQSSARTQCNRAERCRTLNDEIPLWAGFRRSG